jgi:glycosyltransferase involved in cell wall biosynthesis
MNRGGVETWLMHVLRRTDPKRCQIDFLVHTEHPGAYDHEIVARGSRVFSIASFRRPLHYTNELRSHLRGHGPYDVVHSHVHHFSGIVLRAAERELVKARVAHSHNDTRHTDEESSIARVFYRAAMKHLIRRHATTCLAASQEAGEDLFGKHNVEHPWSVMYYGHDFAPFLSEPDKAAVRMELGLPHDAFVLGHVGRFDPQKNHAFLLRIASKVVRLRPGAKLLLIGDGSLRQSIHDTAVSLGLGDAVLFAGVRADVPRLLMGAMNVFVFPSFHEGLPLACTEAQAAGLPLVVSDAITEELDIVPGAVKRLPLSAPAQQWAEACLATEAEPRRTHHEALTILQESAFAIEACLTQLAGVYALTLSNPTQFPLRPVTDK